MLTRRSLLAAGAVAFGCRRRKSTGFDGFAFVANEDGQAVAAVDLTAFAVIRHIRVEGNPTEVLTNPKAPSVYALTPAAGTVHEVRMDKLAVARKAHLGASATSMRLDPAGKRLFVACRDPRSLVCIALDRFSEEWRVPLPSDPVAIDVSPSGELVALTLEGSVGFVNAEEHRLHIVDAGGATGVTRFRSDGKTLITAAPDRQMLLVHDAASRKLMVRLPVALEPEHFCFNADGGQLFVTGKGQDAVVIVYPYHTPQVAETILAGREPGAMAASVSTEDAQYLFIANPPSNDVTILNIANRRVIAMAAVGANPSYITVTPDNQYALVLNQKSGDMGVLVIRSDMANRQKYAGLFTMIPVGSKPVSAAIRSA